MRIVYFDPASTRITSDTPDPYAGGMAHLYTIARGWSDGGGSDTPFRAVAEVSFQHGPVREVGHNGVQHADLYRMIIDRLECAQASLWACPENAEQLEHLRAALAADERRTARRVSAGTEGTSADR